MIATVIPSLMASGVFPDGTRPLQANDPVDCEESTINSAAACVDSASENVTLEQATQSCCNSDSDLWLYRERTIALLRRYLQLSVEVGRLPSLLGREFFRAKVTFYKASTFEDAVIFVHDVERCLEGLNEFDGRLIAMVVLQEYSQEEAAGILRCCVRTVVRRFPEAVDEVSRIFLERGILNYLPMRKNIAPTMCQGGATTAFAVSNSEQTKNNF